MARLFSLTIVLLFTVYAQADEPFVPGTGEFVGIIGDDFEDPRRPVTRTTNNNGLLVESRATDVGTKAHFAGNLMW